MRRRLYGSIYRLANLFPIPTFRFSKTLCSSWPLRWRTIHPSLTARTRLPTKHQTPRSAHPTPSNRISLQPNLSMIKWNSFLSDPGLPWGRTMLEKCPRCLIRCAIDLLSPLVARSQWPIDVGTSSPSLSTHEEKMLSGTRAALWGARYSPQLVYDPRTQDQEIDRSSSLYRRVLLRLAGDVR